MTRAIANIATLQELVRKEKGTSSGLPTKRPRDDYDSDLAIRKRLFQLLKTKAPILNGSTTSVVEFETWQNRVINLFRLYDVLDEELDGERTL